MHIMFVSLCPGRTNHNNPSLLITVFSLKYASLRSRLSFQGPSDRDASLSSSITSRIIYIFLNTIRVYDRHSKPCCFRSEVYNIMGIIEWISSGDSPFDELLSTQAVDFEAVNRLSVKQETPNWVYWAFVLELFLIVLSGFRCIVCFPIFYKYPLFHRNLIALISRLKCMPLITLKFSKYGIFVVGYADCTVYHLCWSNIR